MNVIHLELPRIFTFTVKEYFTEVKSTLESDGHTFRQYDANPVFWRWLMQLSTPYSPGDCLAPLLKTEPDETFWASIAEMQRHLRDISTLYGIKVELAGLRLPAAVADSTYAMCSLIADNFGCALFSGFFQHLDERIHFSGADILTLGNDGQEGVFWALNLAAWMRARGSTAHICIARHGHENFSLVHHVGNLAKNEWFFGLVDSVALYPEELPRTLRLLSDAVKTDDYGALENIAIKPKAGPVWIIPPRAGATAESRVSPPDYSIPEEYFQSMDVPLEHLVYSMAMVRNKCFYKKCTFCVQITKHVGDAAYEPAAELERALNACAELCRHGVQLVNFSDEAMRPVDLRRFSEGLLARKIPVRRVGRMVAAAHPDVATLRLMRDAGCTEILFGIESFDPALLRDMGKISGHSDTAAETLAMIRSYLDAGLFVILSMIYDFPTEPPGSRAATRALAEKIAMDSDRTAFIFNRFGLFHTSAIYKDPARFGIEPPGPALPHNDIQYVFPCNRLSNPDPLTADEAQLYRRLKFGMDGETYAALHTKHGAELLDIAHFFDYNSIGFVHRALHDRTFLSSFCIRNPAVAK
ncbi:MAG: radical SAM protein [Chthoniobacteraceae bacterium]